MTQKRCRLTCLLFALVVLGSKSVAGQLNPAAALPGRWEANPMPSGPWIFEFAVDGTTVTGRIMQHGGVPGPAPIHDGTIQGSIVTFKVRHPFASPPRDISFTGRVAGTELSIERAVGEVVSGMPFDIGLFGTSGPARFAARRLGPVPVPPVPATTNVSQARRRHRPLGKPALEP